jgi:hypothetical protein
MLLIGNPTSRRTQMLRDALSRVGGALELVEWRQLLARPGRACELLTAQVCASHVWCKVETPGDDPTLDDLLIERGWRLMGAGAARPQALRHGELAHRRLRFAGFADALREISVPLAGLHLLNDIAGILLMCDKWACQQHLRAHGIDVPAALCELESFEIFDAAFPARDFPAVFLKSRYGSSAAGVIALRRHPDGRLVAYSSARLDESGAIGNHLGIKRYTQRTEIAALVDAVIAQGAYAERWQPKSSLPGARDSHYDLRVVAASGAARQRVARISRSPLTNLHLGNARAVPDWLSDIEVRTLEQAVARAAAAFPRSHNIGFDLCLAKGGACVFEANAFGDLLPDLHIDGRTTYDDQALLVSRDE